MKTNGKQPPAGAGFQAKAILTSGIPLEMAAYDLLSAKLDADWISSAYEFPMLNPDGSVIQRSVDFVASVPTSRRPLDGGGIQFYLLVECKYTGPKESIWLFMPDTSPVDPGVFDSWRPALWQASEPRDPDALNAVVQAVSGLPGASESSPATMPRCVRGTTLCSTEQNTRVGDGDHDQANRRSIRSLDTGLHQLRDCLHMLAVERFRLFTKLWTQPAAIAFVPLVVTNASLHVLKPAIHNTLLSTPGDQKLGLDDVSTETSRLLVRCPASHSQVDWKWQKFIAAHGQYDLSRVERGLPAYKRERSIETHLLNFFSTVPSYVPVVTIEELPRLLDEVVAWAGRLEFPQTSGQ